MITHAGLMRTSTDTHRIKRMTSFSSREDGPRGPPRQRLPVVRTYPGELVVRLLRILCLVFIGIFLIPVTASVVFRRLILRLRIAIAVLARRRLVRLRRQHGLGHALRLRLQGAHQRESCSMQAK